MKGQLSKKENLSDNLITQVTQGGTWKPLLDSQGERSVLAVCKYHHHSVAAHFGASCSSGLSQT